MDTDKARRKANFKRWLREGRVTPKAAQECAALSYVDWLVKRDRLRPPKGYRVQRRVDYGYVELPNGKWQTRPRAVVWYREHEEWYDDRGKGLRWGYGQRLHGYRKVVTTLRTIEIPHWDHVPQMTEEVIAD
jgi:hypothetical protein